jgi:excisionase family DNA binding protein
MSTNFVNKHESLATQPTRGVSPEAEALLTVHEVAQLLRVPVSWVYERTRRRGTERLPHLKIGKYLRVRREDVLGWLDACKL